MQKKYLSPEYLAAAQEYRDMRTELNKILRKKKAERTEAETNKVDQLRQSMKDNAQRQKILLQNHLSNVSTKILSSSFRFNLTPDASKDPQKPLYSIGATAEEFFAMQVLCRNVKKLFKITMSSRHEILSQLKILLREDKSWFYIIRTDVCHCFESIPHDKLFEYLEGNNLLDVKSKSLLRGLIRNEFEIQNLRKLVSTPKTGIPRGCAISSLLSELYLSKIDEILRRTLPGIVFLARYVDDIIIVIHPDLDDEHRWSLDDYIKVLIDTYCKMKDSGVLQEVNNWDEYTGSMLNSEVAGVINGCWIMGTIQTAEDQSGKWAITNIPKLTNVKGATNYSNIGGSSWAISGNCGNVELAEDFLASTFAGSTELYDNILSCGAISTWTPAGDSDAYAVPNEFFSGDAVFEKIVDYSTKVPSIITGPYFHEARDAISVATTNITNGADLEEELKKAEDTVNFNMGQ